MTEHKFTDEEIIKALENYKGFRLYPFDKYQEGNDVILVDDALDLINRQREEIEVIKETTAEIRYEAVKEFAERLKTYYRNLDKTAGALIEYHIDEIVKEMLEGDVCGANTETER
jgi:hypothetical protein